MSDEVIGPVKLKDHFFDIVMRSVSRDENGDWVLNQEVPLLREFANSPGELALKQMTFTKDAGPDIVAAIIAAMDKQSMPLQELGMKEIQELFEAFAQGGGNVPPGQNK